MLSKLIALAIRQRAQEMNDRWPPGVKIGERVPYDFQLLSPVPESVLRECPPRIEMGEDFVSIITPYVVKCTDETIRDLDLVQRADPETFRNAQQIFGEIVACGGGFAIDVSLVSASLRWGKVV